MQKPTTAHQRAFTLVEIMIVVLIIGILMAIAVPAYTKSRANGQRSACIDSLREIESAKEQYAMENKLTNGDTVALTDLIGATLYIKRLNNCAAGGTYTINPIGTYPTCNVPTHAYP